MQKRTINFIPTMFMSASLLLFCGFSFGSVNPVSVNEGESLSPGVAEKETNDKLPPGISSDWWSTVQENIRKSEYHVTWQDKTHLPDIKAAYQAPNRAQNLRTYFTDYGALITPRTSEEPEWSWGLFLNGYGFKGGVDQVDPATPVPSENRVEYPRGDVIEWYVNDERGLEQGFTLKEPPGSKEGETEPWIVLRLALHGNLKGTLNATKEKIEFLTPSGVRVVEYGKLYAFDAAGKDLPARFVMNDAGVDILVDTKEALYPLTIDPLTFTSIWTAEGNQAGAEYGFSVSTAGDVNNDGYSDVIVGALGYDNGQSNEGRAFVYHGSATGLSTTANWTAESNQNYACFGNSVSTAGDVNNDGYSDVIVGASYYYNGETNEGGAFVYHGSATGLSAAAAWTAESDQADAWFGYSVSTAGDVNNDGYSDVIVGALGYDNGQSNEGRAFVYHGSATGLSTTANWTAESNQNYAYFGNSVSTAGDVNNDGYSDVIVGANWYDNGQGNEGRAFVYHGSATGLSAAAAWTAESNQTCAYFGNSVSTAGDINGDGYSDVIVGALLYDNGEMNEGGAFVYHGSATGLSTAPDWTAESNQADAWFGYSVSTAGDVNGDGYGDVIVGAYTYDDTSTDEGRAFVYHGSSSGLSTSADWTADGNQASAEFGFSVSTAGDVNGDGYSDVIVGAYLYDNGHKDEGRAFVYYGSATGLTPSDWTGAQFGFSVSTAGDVNGDGYSDVIVGARYYDNGETEEGKTFAYHGSSSGLSTLADWTAEGNQTTARFGESVSAAGDINGDGYSDVIVGALFYDNGETNEGGAFVYHGSATGLSTAPDWTAEGGQNDARFGVSVSTAGDVNGDGYGDVIVGAYTYDDTFTDEGRAFVYHGSSSGLSTSADWTADGNQASAEFGFSVSTAGDVNGDGYSDVIVGARYYDDGETDEGKTFVYHGSSSGLSAPADWIAEGNQTTARFGESVSTAGDINGDGYSDVIVGALFYDNGETNEGGAFVYHGSATGLSTAPDWTAEGGQNDARFGVSVSTAGDVNGDGYGDVIVGAYTYDDTLTDEGRAFVYHGSSSGLSTSFDWAADGNQTSAVFGFSVSTAGDVNGDGYSDIIVGARDYDNVYLNEGGAFVYHGSATGLSSAADWTAESDQADACFGISVSTAGDVNGDGYSDVIVGAYTYDDSYTDEGRAFVFHGSSSGLSTIPDWTADGNQVSACFGISVSTAGDVNGDGYSDVIAGAYHHDNGQTDEGRVYVYLGSSSGLNAFPDWTAEGNQAGAEYGFSVSTAGDVNGDGYSDVIVGARYYDTPGFDGGRAFVYHGSASGLSATADWTGQTDQMYSRFGESVATAGDVNGDGYSDVIVGALWYDNPLTNEGGAFVYYGSASGLNTTPDWTTEGGQIDARYGVSVSSAGDVNGDGYSDVIVGAYTYDDTLTDEGRAFIYYGSSSGLSTSADWTADGNQASATFGFSVSTAGDVNGDGYSDVIVCARDYTNGHSLEGKAFVYLGTASGLNTTEDWSAEGDQTSAYFGYSLSTAGDVNGDGYSDVIVGAYKYDNGQTDEGRAFVYYGNNGAGLSLAPRQRQGDDASPLAHLGMPQNNTFRLALDGRTPHGRGKVKLEWEVEPFGTPFDGLGTTVSTSWMDTGTTGATISERVTGLSANTVYHWRMRLLYSPATTPFQPYSRWFTPTANGMQEADLRYNDTDGDVLSDVFEDTLGTDSNDVDSDDDNIDDSDEYNYWGSNWNTNYDGDGITNNLLDDDSDGDGHLDGDEITAGTDPSDPNDPPTIPTLSEWGMIIFAVLLITIGVIVIRRRQRH